MEYQVSFADRITHIVVRGALAVQDIVQIVRDEFPRLPTGLVLCDLSASDITAITPEDFLTIAAATRMVTPENTSRKTAYVAGTGATYAKLCRYLNVASLARVPVEYAVFTTADEATRWLHAQ